MRKKQYVTPITEKCGILLNSFVATSPASWEADKNGDNKGGNLDKDNGNDESDAKNFNAWSSWDE